MGVKLTKSARSVLWQLTAVHGGGINHCHEFCFEASGGLVFTVFIIYLLLWHVVVLHSVVNRHTVYLPNLKKTDWNQSLVRLDDPDLLRPFDPVLIGKLAVKFFLFVTQIHFSAIHKGMGDAVAHDLKGVAL